MPKIIPTMKRLGYSPVEQGMCLGIASMGANAVIRKDIDSFYNRVLRIHNLTEEKLTSIIKERESKKVDDLYHFFDGVAIYQGNDALPYDIRKALYAVTKKEGIEKKIIFKGLKASTEIVNEKLAFADIKRTLVCPMTTRKLVSFVNELKKSLKGHPFSLMIQSVKFNHVTQLGFDGNLWLAVNHDLVNVFKDEKTSINAIIPNVVPNYYETENDIVNLSLDILLSEQSSVDLSWVNKYELSNADINTLKKEPRSFLDFINQCCYSNQHEIIRNLSRYINHSLINEMIKNQSSPLLNAAIMGNTETVEVLLDVFNKIPLTTDEYIKLLAVSEDGFATLSTASVNGHVDVVKLLLEKIPLTFDQFAESDNSMPALYCAAQEGHADIVKLFIESMQNSDLPINQQLSLLQAKNMHGLKPLFIAAFNGHVDTIKVLLEAIDALKLPTEKRLTFLEAKDHNNISALKAAAKRGNIKVIEMLLAAFDEMNLTTKQQLALLDNSTCKIPALTFAAQEGHTKVIELLLKRLEKMQLTADQYLEQVNIKNENNASALYLAACGDYDETVKKLICAIEHFPLTKQQRFELFNAKNSKDNDTTPFFVSVLNGNTAIAERLIKAFSDAQFNAKQLEILLSARVKEGVSALYIAVEEGYLDIVKAILTAIKEMPFTTEQRIELLKAELHGDTVLYLAASKGHASKKHAEIFEALIHTMADIPMTEEQRLACASNLLLSSTNAQ